MTTATIMQDDEPITPRQKDLLLSLIFQCESEERELFLQEMEGCATKTDASELISFLINGI